MNDAEAAAVAAFPEVKRLLQLVDAGWTFLTPFTADGHVVQVQAFRAWPDGWVDVIRVRSTSDAAGARSDIGDPPQLVWSREGGLEEVVTALMELPAPGMPGAPRLSRGTSKGLWAP
ncbi:MAG TPA: hypothetical protein VNO31_15465 [Umezawaea sp.]|nr:hypothetical protein [Umezawaea sp.]